MICTFERGDVKWNGVIFSSSVIQYFFLFFIKFCNYRFIWWKKIVITLISITFLPFWVHRSMIQWFISWQQLHNAIPYIYLSDPAREENDNGEKVVKVTIVNFYSIRFASFWSVTHLPNDYIHHFLTVPKTFSDLDPGAKLSPWVMSTFSIFFISKALFTTVMPILLLKLPFPSLHKQ